MCEIVPSSLSLSHLDGGLGEQAVAKRHRHGDPRVLRLRQIRQFVHRLVVDAPRLLHEERNAGVDEEAELRRHRDMTAECDDELGLRLVDHHAVVGVGRAVVLARPTSSRSRRQARGHRGCPPSRSAGCEGSSAWRWRGSDRRRSRPRAAADGRSSCERSAPARLRVQPIRDRRSRQPGGRERPGAAETLGV